MRSRSRALLLAGLVLGSLFAGAVPALAAETANSQFVIIQEDDVLTDDLYAGAIKVVVEGVIDGDLIAFAGEEVVINGEVTGSVYAASPRVTVTGTVAGSLRATTNDLVVSGSIGRDLVAPAVDVRLSEESEVGNDVLLWALSVEALGTIGGDLSGSQRSLDLGGTIEGDVDVSVGQVTIVAPLQVAGDFGYRSDNPAEGLELAEVEGAVVHKLPLPPNIRVRALSLFGRFIAVLFLTIAALGVAWAWPQRFSAAMQSSRSSPFGSWALGALVMLSPLLVALAAGLLVGLGPAAAAYPLLAILVPVIIAMLGIVLALSLVAGAPAAASLGSVLFKRLDLYGATVVGSLIAGLVWLVPLVGWLVPLVLLPMGMGAWITALRDPTAPDGTVG